MRVRALRYFSISAALLTHTTVNLSVPLQLQSLPQSTSLAKRGGLATAKLSDIRLLRWRPNDNSRRRLRQRQGQRMQAQLNCMCWRLARMHLRVWARWRIRKEERESMGDYDTARCQKLTGISWVNGGRGGLRAWRASWLRANFTLPTVRNNCDNCNSEWVKAFRYSECCYRVYILFIIYNECKEWMGLLMAYNYHTRLYLYSILISLIYYYNIFASIFSYLWPQKTGKPHE